MDGYVCGAQHSRQRASDRSDTSSRSVAPPSAYVYLSCLTRVADEHEWSGDQLACFLARFCTKAAAQLIIVPKIGLLMGHRNPSTP